MTYVWIDGVLFYQTLDYNEARDMVKFLIEQGIDKNTINISVKGKGGESRSVAQQMTSE